MNKPIDASAAADVLRRVQCFIAAHELLPPADEQGVLLVVGLSGGPDSVALAHVLSALGYDLLLTHCHFGLRGEEAERDLEFCRQLAAVMGLPFRETRFDTYAYARQHHCSIEMACRELRYDWWQREFLSPASEVGQQHRVVRLCVGHHIDDSIETFLLNLMRGTGLRGLVGIPPRNGAVVRPLLCLTRAEILQYLSSNGLSYVTDSTNLETEYQRNKIRNLLLPLMEQVNGNARRGIVETMHHLTETMLMAERGRYELVDKHVQTFSHDRVQFHRLARAAFAADFPAEGLVHAFVEGHAALSRPLELSIAHAVTEGKKNLLFMTNEAVLCLEEASLVMCLRSENSDVPWCPDFHPREGQGASPCASLQGQDATFEMLLTEHPNFEVTDLCVDEQTDAASVVDQAKKNRDSETAFVDCDKVCWPLRLRRWREGDRLRPLGMKDGSKLVSDLMSNARLSPLQKAWSWVVVDAEERIVWVSGLRLSDDVKVDAQSRRVVRICHRP